MSRTTRLGGSVQRRVQTEMQLHALLCDWRPLHRLGRTTGRRARMLLHTLAHHVPHLARDTDLAEHTPALEALAAVPWIRAPDRWSPTPGRHAIGSLLDHLLVRVRHPMPGFLRPLAIAGCRDSTRVLARLGDARGLRGPELPWTLTKRMLHVLSTLDHAQSFTAAVRTAQITALGGDSSVLDAVLTTRLRDRTSAPAWWQEVLEWTCRVGLPEDDDQLGPLYDYLDTLRRNGQEPPKRQGLRRMVRESERWHAQVSAPARCMPRVPLPRPTFEHGRFVLFGHHWLIRPMRTVFELYLEGRVLRHCVATYAAKALGGNSSLWTMRRDGRRTITLEVSERGKLLEARGRFNRGLDTTEWAVVHHWAEQAGIELM